MSDTVIIYTDGSALGNPGPGGWGAILRYGNEQKEISGGYKNTTNNRMELMAVIEALSHLKRACHIEIYSDSRYFIDAMNQGWLLNWKKNGWKTAAKKPVKNRDLWEKIETLTQNHTIKYIWVKAHNQNPDNERCDLLAKEAASKSPLPPDKNYK